MKIEYTFGQKLGSCLYINEEVGKKAKSSNKIIRRARFRCKCGNLFISHINSVKGGTAKTCGCSHIENAFITHGHSRGNKRTKEFRAWSQCILRCKSDHKFRQYYYDKDITVCDRWQGENGFLNFLSDMGKSPSPTHSLDRRDGTKGYNPENCRWATWIEQNSNKSNNIFLTHNGKTQTAAEWARELDFTHSMILRRISRGWDIDKILLPPTRKRPVPKNVLLP